MSSKDELAVVTGAGSGIGKATARLLAHRGLRVVCVGRREEPLEATVHQIRQDGGDGKAVPADITTDEGVDRIRSAIDDEQRSTAVLVHAAGKDLVASLVDTPRATLQAVMDVNLMGPFLLTAGLQTSFTERSAVVFVASIAARAGRDLHAAYGAAKAALFGLTRNLAAELAPITRVNCVGVGPTRTAMLDDFLANYAAAHEGEEESLAAERRRRLLLQRPADPEEIAETVVHLALDATATTGAIWMADVGYTAT